MWKAEYLNYDKKQLANTLEGIEKAVAMFFVEYPNLSDATAELIKTELKVSDLNFDKTINAQNSWSNLIEKLYLKAQDPLKEYWGKEVKTSDAFQGNMSDFKLVFRGRNSDKSGLKSKMAKHLEDKGYNSYNYYKQKINEQWKFEDVQISKAEYLEILNQVEKGGNSNKKVKHYRPGNKNKMPYIKKQYNIDYDGFLKPYLKDSKQSLLASQKQYTELKKVKDLYKYLKNPFSKPSINSEAFDLFLINNTKFSFNLNDVFRKYISKTNGSTKLIAEFAKKSNKKYGEINAIRRKSNLPISKLNKYTNKLVKFDKIPFDVLMFNNGKNDYSLRYYSKYAFIKKLIENPELETETLEVYSELNKINFTDINATDYVEFPLEIIKRDYNDICKVGDIKTITIKEHLFNKVARNLVKIDNDDYIDYRISESEKANYFSDHKKAYDAILKFPDLSMNNKQTVAGKAEKVDKNGEVYVAAVSVTPLHYFMHYYEYYNKKDVTNMVIGDILNKGVDLRATTTVGETIPETAIHHGNFNVLKYCKNMISENVLKNICEKQGRGFWYMLDPKVAKFLGENYPALKDANDLTYKEHCRHMQKFSVKEIAEYNLLLSRYSKKCDKPGKTETNFKYLNGSDITRLTQNYDSEDWDYAILNPYKMKNLHNIPNDYLFVINDVDPDEFSVRIRSLNVKNELYEKYLMLMKNIFENIESNKVTQYFTLMYLNSSKFKQNFIKGLSNKVRENIKTLPAEKLNYEVTKKFHGDLPF